MAIRTETRGATDSVVVAACDCCRAFCSADGGVIRHASHCDGGKRSEHWAPGVVAAPLAVGAIGHSVPLNAVGNGAAEDDFHAINSRNPRDWNRAMNRDD